MMKYILLCILVITPTISVLSTTKDIRNTTSIRDTYIALNTSTTNYGSADSMRCNSNGSGVFTDAVIMSFANFRDSAGGPWGKYTTVIDTCILQLNVRSRTTFSTITIFAKMKPDSEVVATYNIWGTSNNWGSSGCKTAGTTENTSSGSGSDFDSTTIVINAQSIGTGNQSFDITSLAQQWMNGTRNPLYGIKIVAGGGNNKIVVFNSSEHATTGSQPLLHVVYRDTTSAHRLTNLIHDVTISSASANTNYGTDTMIRCASTAGDPSTKTVKYITSFTNLSDSVPTSLIIDTAKYFFLVTGISGSPTIYTTRLYKQGIDSFATWNKWKDSAGSGSDKSWGTAGAENTSGTSENTSDGSGVDTRFSDSSIIVSSQAVTLGWNSINITTAFKRWRDGLWSQSYGMISQSTDGAATMGFDAVSVNSPYVSSRPYIYLVTHAAATGQQATTRTMPGKILDRNKDRRY